jgi:transcriptional regulator with XRE-family HTH domain
MSGPELDPNTASALFGKRLREIRLREGLSQEELARRADLHLTVVARLDRGERSPGLVTILRLAAGLDVDPGELLTGLLDDLQPPAA